MADFKETLMYTESNAVKYVASPDLTGKAGTPDKLRDYWLFERFKKGVVTVYDGGSNVAGMQLDQSKWTTEADVVEWNEKFRPGTLVQVTDSAKRPTATGAKQNEWDVFFGKDVKAVTIGQVYRRNTNVLLKESTVAAQEKPLFKLLFSDAGSVADMLWLGFKDPKDMADATAPVDPTPSKSDNWYLGSAFIASDNFTTTDPLQFGIVSPNNVYKNSIWVKVRPYAEAKWEDEKYIINPDYNQEGDPNYVLGGTVDDVDADGKKVSKTLTEADAPFYSGTPIPGYDPATPRVIFVEAQHLPVYEPLAGQHDQFTFEPNDITPSAIVTSDPQRPVGVFVKTSGDYDPDSFTDKTWFGKVPYPAGTVVVKVRPYDEADEDNPVYKFLQADAMFYAITGEELTKLTPYFRLGSIVRFKDDMFYIDTTTGTPGAYSSIATAKDVLVSGGAKIFTDKTYMKITSWSTDASTGDEAAIAAMATALDCEVTDIISSADKTRLASATPSAPVYVKLCKEGTMIQALSTTAKEVTKTVYEQYFGTNPEVLPEKNTLWSPKVSTTSASSTNCVYQLVKDNAAVSGSVDIDVPTYVEVSAVPTDSTTPSLSDLKKLPLDSTIKVTNFISLEDDTTDASKIFGAKNIAKDTLFLVTGAYSETTPMCTEVKMKAEESLSPSSLKTNETVSTSEYALGTVITLSESYNPEIASPDAVIKSILGTKPLFKGTKLVKVAAYKGLASGSTCYKVIEEVGPQYVDVNYSSSAFSYDIAGFTGDADIDDMAALPIGSIVKIGSNFSFKREVISDLAVASLFGKITALKGEVYRVDSVYSYKTAIPDTGNLSYVETENTEDITSSTLQNLVEKELAVSTELPLGSLVKVTNIAWNKKITVSGSGDYELAIESAPKNSIFKKVGKVDDSTTTGVLSAWDLVSVGKDYADGWYDGGTSDISVSSILTDIYEYDSTKNTVADVMPAGLCNSGAGVVCGDIIKLAADYTPPAFPTGHEEWSEAAFKLLTWENKLKLVLFGEDPLFAGTVLICNKPFDATYKSKSWEVFEDLDAQFIEITEVPTATDDALFTKLKYSPIGTIVKIATPKNDIDLTATDASATAIEKALQDIFGRVTLRKGQFLRKNSAFTPRDISDTPGVPDELHPCYENIYDVIFRVEPTDGSFTNTDGFIHSLAL